MKWQIPAKTFLLGEYAAIAGESAILLTTTPCFEFILTNQEGLSGIHPDSPAGQWWQQKKHPGKGLAFNDPYQGCGGLGASSAQFLASYLADCHLNTTPPNLHDMLQAYYQVSWSGQGLKPSAYDVIAQLMASTYGKFDPLIRSSGTSSRREKVVYRAMECILLPPGEGAQRADEGIKQLKLTTQSHQGCVFINKQTNTIHSYPWPFQELSFLLLHTGVKLATHEHLQTTSLPEQIIQLSAIVDEARVAFEEKNSNQLINAINSYHQMLTELNLIAGHSLEQINKLKAFPEILAIKGCGAMGSDVLLVITQRSSAPALKEKLLSLNWTILATEDNLIPVMLNVGWF